MWFTLTPVSVPGFTPARPACSVVEFLAYGSEPWPWLMLTARAHARGRAARGSGVVVLSAPLYGTLALRSLLLTRKAQLLQLGRAGRVWPAVPPSLASSTTPSRIDPEGWVAFSRSSPAARPHQTCAIRGILVAGRPSATIRDNLLARSGLGSRRTRESTGRRGVYSALLRDSSSCERAFFCAHVRCDVSLMNFMSVIQTTRGAVASFHESDTYTTQLPRLSHHDQLVKEEQPLLGMPV